MLSSLQFVYFGVMHVTLLQSLDDFTLGDEIGQGAFSHVVRAKDPSGTECALKLIQIEAQLASSGMSAAEQDAIGPANEVRMMRMLGDIPSIVPCISAFKATCSGCPGDKALRIHLVVIQMPLMKGTLQQWLIQQSPNPSKVSYE
jgi:hypothetical protein